MIVIIIVALRTSSVVSTHGSSGAPPSAIPFVISAEPFAVVWFCWPFPRPIAFSAAKSTKELELGDATKGWSKLKIDCSTVEIFCEWPDK